MNNDKSLISSADISKTEQAIHKTPLQKIDNGPTVIYDIQIHSSSQIVMLPSLLFWQTKPSRILDLARQVEPSFQIFTLSLNKPKRFNP